jgi:hypothetical protein
MSVQGVEEEASTSRGLTAPLISIIMLFVVVLGLSAYWWNIARLTTCTTSRLKVSLGQPQGAAGTSYMNVVLTNTGVGSCTLSGYPAVFLTNAAGSVLGAGAAASAGLPTSKLILARNTSVHALVGFPDATNFQPGVCSSASHNLEVYPPGLATSLRLPFTQYSCPGFSITAFVAGS